MARLPFASEALLSKYSFVSAGAFVGLGCLAAPFLSSVLKKAAVIWLGLLRILGSAVFVAGQRS